MFDKETARDIELVNANLGTRHRSKPYDLNNADDLKEALTIAVGAYRDYKHYRNTLITLCENFDESLEHYDTSTWLNMDRVPEKADELASECADVLGSAEAMFYEITDRAEEYCATIVKAALSTPPATQKTVLDKAYKIAPQDIANRIEGLFDMLDEVPYHHSIPDNFEAFLKLMAEVWADAIIG